MRFFKGKAENKNKVAKNSLITEKFIGYYERLQSEWAKWMTKRTALFSNKEWMMALIAFVLVMGGYSGYLVAQGFCENEKKIFSVAPSGKPIDMGKPVYHKDQSKDVRSAEYFRIVRFRRYMDSLSKDPSSVEQYDSIMQKRPGLMDSINKIENDHQKFKNR